MTARTFSKISSQILAKLVEMCLCHMRGAFAVNTAGRAASVPRIYRAVFRRLFEICLLEAVGSWVSQSSEHYRMPSLEIVDRHSTKDRKPNKKCRLDAANQ